jgi:AraC-like DNA-binding protein
MSEVLTEITQLSDLDCFYIAERHKTEFTYPLHRHREFELNFIEHGAGVRRIVGDSIETIGEYDLTLIGAENLEHVWENGTCQSPDIREITIQFAPDFLGDKILEKNQFDSIRKMLKAAEHGLSFPLDSIMRVYHYLDTLASEQDHFQQFLKFMSILNELSKGEYKILASSSFAHSSRNQESRRVTKVKQYINDHYAEDLRLDNMAALVGMSPSAFSRFFKMRTGKSLSDYILDIRLGYAARMLVDSTKNISEICYESGFNNLSNFNRIFKSKRGSTPRDFRALYKKNKIIV